MPCIRNRKLSHALVFFYKYFTNAPPFPTKRKYNFFKNKHYHCIVWPDTQLYIHRLNKTSTLFSRHDKADADSKKAEIQQPLFCDLLSLIHQKLRSFFKMQSAEITTFQWIAIVPVGHLLTLGHKGHSLSTL